MSKYKVLWIDDQWEEMKAFIRRCDKSESIEIIPSTNAEDGMRIFEEHLSEWDGVILDAKVLLSSRKDEMPSLKGLSYCVNRMNELSSKRKVPKYIYTGQPDLYSNEMFSDSFGRFYQKVNDNDILIQDIIKGAQELEETQICFKYADVVAVVPEAKHKLISLLLAIEHGVTNNPDLLGKARKIIELIENFCYDHGICPFKLGMENINEFSKFMSDSKMSEYVPGYIQETIRYCVRVLNPSAHALDLDQDIEKDRYPYLIRSVAYSILDLLTWCKTLPQTDEEILIVQQKTLKIQEERKKMAQLVVPESIEEYEGLNILIEKDEQGNLHGGKCLISSKLINKIGKYATLAEVRTNTNSRSKDLYPFFAKLKE